MKRYDTNHKKKKGTKNTKSQTRKEWNTIRTPITNEIIIIVAVVTVKLNNTNKKRNNKPIGKLRKKMVQGTEKHKKKNTHNEREGNMKKGKEKKKAKKNETTRNACFSSPACVSEAGKTTAASAAETERSVDGVSSEEAGVSISLTLSHISSSS